MVRHAVSGTGQKKVQLISVQLLFEVNGSNIRNIVKSHVLDSKASSFKTFQVTMFFSNIPLCLPLTLLHVVPMRWLDHFLIQTSPSSQHNSPLLGITSAVYIFPPMLMEIWRVQGCLGQISKTNTSPPKKNWAIDSKDSMCFEVSEKTILPQWWEVFSFSWLGFVNPNRGKFGHLHGVPLHTNGRLLRSSHRKFGRIRTKIWSPGENVGLKACLDFQWLLPGSLVRRFEKPFLPESRTCGVEVLLENLWGILMEVTTFVP